MKPDGAERELLSDERIAGTGATRSEDRSRDADPMGACGALAAAAEGRLRDAYERAAADAIDS